MEKLIFKDVEFIINEQTDTDIKMCSQGYTKYMGFEYYFKEYTMFDLNNDIYYISELGMIDEYTEVFYLVLKKYS